jgi:hypothetical protein
LSLRKELKEAREQHKQQHHPQRQQQQSKLQVRINAKEFSLILTTECTEIPPLVKIKLQQAQLTSDNFPEDQLQANLALTGSYYNMLKVVWEPLIEDATAVLLR